jgi:inactive STAND
VPASTSKEPTNTYWLTAEGQHALEFLVSQVESNGATTPSFSYNMPTDSGLDRYTTFKQIIDQFNLINYPKGITFAKWQVFVNFYHSKISESQKILLHTEHPEIKNMLSGNKATYYLTNQNPFPKTIDPSIKISKSQKIVELMCNLDYQELGQEKKFRSIIMNNNSVGIALSIPINNQYLQKWLIYRLMRWVKDGAGSWDEIEIQCNGKYDMPWSLQYFWEQLARNNTGDCLSASINDILNNINVDLNENNSQDLIVVLAKYIKGKHILIRVKNIQKLQVEELIKKFWNPLINQLNKDSNNNDQKLQLLMFIVTEESFSFNRNYGVHCLEPPLTIDEQVVKRWINSPNVREYLLLYKTEAAIQELLTRDIPAWDYSSSNLPNLFDLLIRYTNYDLTLEKISESCKI